MTWAILTTPTADPDGAVVLPVLPDSLRWERRRRISRVSTLDGGAAVNDAGFCPADQTITLRWAPAQALDAAVERLLRLYGSLTLSLGGGLYRVAPEAYTPGATENALTLLVTHQLAP